MVLSTAATISATAATFGANGGYSVSTDATSGTFDLSLLGAPGGAIELIDLPFDIEPDGTDGLEARLEATGGVDVIVRSDTGSSTRRWEIEFVSPSSGLVVTVDGEDLVRTAPINVSARTTEEIAATLGSGDDVVQLTSGMYRFHLRINAGDGDDTINIENGVDLGSRLATINGDGGDDLLFVGFLRWIDR